MTRFTSFFERLSGWLSNDSFEAQSAFYATRVLVALMISVVVDIFSPVPWWISAITLLGLFASVALLKKQLRRSPLYDPPAPDIRIYSDSTTEITAITVTDDGIDGLHGVIVRHWKYFAKRVAAHIMASLLFISIGIAGAIQDVFVVPPEAWLVYFLLLILSAPLMVYLIKREQFRWEHLIIEVRGDDVILNFPDSRPFFFRGGALIVPILSIATISLHKRTFMELFWFRAVRTVTIDSPSDQDKQLHDMTDVLDAETMIDVLRQ